MHVLCFVSDKEIILYDDRVAYLSFIFTVKEKHEMLLKDAA